MQGSEPGTQVTSTHCHPAPHSIDNVSSYGRHQGREHSTKETILIDLEATFPKKWKFSHSAS